MLKAAPDLVRRRLAEKGLVFGEGTIRRFLDRHGITRKKDGARERTGASGRREAAAGLGRQPVRS